MMGLEMELQGLTLTRSFLVADEVACLTLTVT